MIDRLKRFNKKSFINCNIKDGVEKVIKRKLKEDSLFQKDYGYDISSIAMDLRRIKLEKLKEQMLCKMEI